MAFSERRRSKPPQLALFSPNSRSAGAEDRLRPAMEFLLQASCYAQDLRRTAWDFAVEITALRNLGLTTNDLRWLIWKGFIEYAHEVKSPQEDQRAFESEARLLFLRRTCFVLTETGVEWACSLCSRSAAAGAPGDVLVDESSAPKMTSEVECPLPSWDPHRRELWLGDKLVKRFRLPSRNQEVVLSTFHEEGWPTRIDDPLPAQCEINRKERLHETIRSLNRNQKEFVIRFGGDGTGEGVLWELKDDLSRPERALERLTGNPRSHR